MTIYIKILLWKPLQISKLIFELLMLLGILLLEINLSPRRAGDHQLMIQ